MVFYPFKQDVNKNYQFFFFLTKKFYRRNIECIFPFGSKWYEFFTIKRMAKKLQSFRLKYL